MSRFVDLWKINAAERGTSGATRMLAQLRPDGPNFTVGTRATYAVLAPQTSAAGRFPIVAVDHAPGRVTTLTSLTQTPWYGVALSPDRWRARQILDGVTHRVNFVVRREEVFAVTRTRTRAPDTLEAEP